jgi:hypothetical protein
VTFLYCGSGCVPASVPVPLSDFNQGQNVLVAVETDNINPSLVFSSWLLEITCSGGFQWVISSATYPTIPLYFDPLGTCPGALPPGTDGGGNQWYSYAYNPASTPFTLTGAPVTGTTFAALVVDPLTTSSLPPVSYNASGSVTGACGSLYWRELVAIPTPTFTPTPTLTPTFTPTFTTTSTATLTPTFTFTNTPTITYTPTNTFTPTLTFTPTNTFTLTNTATVTPTHTPTFTPTVTNTFTHTFTPTNSFTPTNTFTPTDSPTPCGYPGNTCTPTPTPADTFYVSQNAFNPTNGPVSIFVAYSLFPGNYSLMVYNSAGEHIKTLDSQNLGNPIDRPYFWDGTNKYGDKCASGVYILYLVEPFGVKIKRILLIR